MRCVSACPSATREYARLVNEQENHLKTIRGLFRIKQAAELGRAPVDISEVEPAVDIVKRFATGAMSYGSISKPKPTRPSPSR